ncbi:MAG TPA: ABC transporter ATP-binding protein [Desulfocapsa sulfexigens]|nr:ABC transporter ATP-binding protein [Desulfocapsa sulfexigens]
MSETPRLQLKGMTKIYPSVIANDSIDMTIAPGEIHAVLGENGAGKSTLMKAIYGVVKPDKGQILWNGEVVNIQNPAHARKLGIGMVFQHFSLFETLTVTENIAVAMDDYSSMDSLACRIKDVSEEYGLPLDPGRLVHSLSVGLRQRVEILRCLLQQPKLLIMDEPTSVLTPQAVRKMFETLRRLASEGCSILYISHKLDEIMELCHSATIIRGGKVTGYAIPASETATSLAKMMIGKDLPVCSQEKPFIDGEACLSVKNLSKTSADQFGTDLKEINFSVRGGEILGIAGISGNGQQELLYALSGEKPVKDNDCISICGKPVGHLNPGARRNMGLGFVPEERLGRGAVPGMSLCSNAILTAHRHDMVDKGLLKFNKAAEFAQKCITGFAVKCGSKDDPITSLSGGNIQKYITGREILQSPTLLVVSQPTWGVDVGAANIIRQAMIDLRNNGSAILVVSEELDELFEICDRLIVIADGHVSSSVNVSETTKEDIGIWMSGMFPGGPAEADTTVQESSRNEEQHAC